METENFTGPVNLESPDEHSVLRVAKKILELTGSGARIEFHPLPEDDRPRRKPDITLAREKILWAPRTNFADGLARTIEYFRQALRSRNTSPKNMRPAAQGCRGAPAQKRRRGIGNFAPPAREDR